MSDQPTPRTERIAENIEIAIRADKREQSIAHKEEAIREIEQLERELAEAREQRDRLAEALQYVMQDLEIELSSRGQRDEQWSSLMTAREALTAVEGGEK